MLFLMIFCALFLSYLPVHGSEVTRRPLFPSHQADVSTLYIANEKSVNQLIESNHQLTTFVAQGNEEIKKLQEEKCNLEKRIITYRWATVTLALATTGFIVKEVATKYPELFPALGKWLAHSIHKASAC